jgi:3-hydroxyacyl-CoA dehydrogenase
MPLIDRSQVRTVAVIGAGTIGASWAALFLARGLAVVASDPRPDGADRVRRFVEGAWPALQRLGLAPGADPGRLAFEPDPAKAAARADFVQESALEDLALKRDLINRVDAALPPERVIASSTSTFMPSLLQEGCRAPGRVLVGHPFNPPHLIPLVEVVGGKATDPAAVAWTVAFYDSIGKRAIHLEKEMQGHLVNRLQVALLREALHCLDEGMASAEDIDAAIAFGPGLRWAIMGPLLLGHLAGGAGGIAHFVDHLADAIDRAWDDLGRPSFTPALRRKFVAEVEAEARGRPVAELERWRDERLLAILAALKETNAV